MSLNFYYLAGLVDLTKEEKTGFNLFKSKGKCVKWGHNTFFLPVGVRQLQGCAESAVMEKLVVCP